MSNQSIEKRELPEWRKRAEFRRENKAWLKYSGKIALRMLSALEDRDDLNQKKLAELANVSPQYISKILKGEENLSLQTIALFSTILKADLITFPSFKYNETSVLTLHFHVSANHFILITPIETNYLLPAIHLEAFNIPFTINTEFQII